MNCIWKQEPTRANTPAIFVTKSGMIVIVVEGYQITMAIEKWHALGKLRVALVELLGER